MFLTSFNIAQMADALNIAVLIFLHYYLGANCSENSLIVIIGSHVDGISRSCGRDKQVTWMG